MTTQSQPGLETFSGALQTNFAMCALKVVKRESSCQEGSSAHNSHPLRDMNNNNSEIELANAKRALIRELIALIRANDFEGFIKFLKKNRPDLNVFINGQTVLHEALILGKSARLVLCPHHGASDLCALSQLFL